MTVVNDLSREELADAIAAQNGQPLGCLPMGLEQYAELLQWLSGSERSPEANASSGKGDSGGAAILSPLGLDPTEFSDLVQHFGKRFFTAAGCPASLDDEAAREAASQRPRPLCSLSAQPQAGGNISCDRARLHPSSSSTAFCKNDRRLPLRISRSQTGQRPPSDIFLSKFVAFPHPEPLACFDHLPKIPRACPKEMLWPLSTLQLLSTM